MVRLSGYTFVWKWIATLGILLLAASACGGNPTPSAPPPVEDPTSHVATSTPTSALALTTVAPLTISPQPSLTPTRTPTPVVLAVEQTPTAAANPDRGVVWDVVITSNTSRQFTNLQKGTVLNTCLTNWRFSIFYVVYPDGTLQGHGSGVTSSPLTCNPHPMPNSSLVTTGEEVTADGTQDNRMLNLRLGVKSITPNPSGDDGGLALLFTTGACPPVRRTIQVPIDSSSPTNFQFKSTDQGQMTGCAGSGKDILQAESSFQVERDWDCGNIPPNFDQQIIDLCR